MNYDLTNLIKQAIVVRKDLGMGKGKLGAQVSHASQEFIWQQGAVFGGAAFEMTLTAEQIRWRETGYRKILLAVNSEAELFAVRAAAMDAGLTVHIVCDEGLTQIEAGTFTCLAIGPHHTERLDPITKGLKLL